MHVKLACRPPYLGILAEPLLAQVHPGCLVQLLQQTRVHDVNMFMRNMKREVQMHKSAKFSIHYLQQMGVNMQGRNGDCGGRKYLFLWNGPRSVRKL
jgi:hypothetical protein